VAKKVLNYDGLTVEITGFVDKEPEEEPLKLPDVTTRLGPSGNLSAHFSGTRILLTPELFWHQNFACPSGD
jgi:hypothetical protein